MKITKKAVAGINVYRCPICKGGDMGGALFARLGFRDYAKMRAYGTVTKKVGCNNENHSHMIEVVMEPPAGATCMLRDD